MTGAFDDSTNATDKLAESQKKTNAIFDSYQRQVDALKKSQEELNQKFAAGAI